MSEQATANSAAVIESTIADSRTVVRVRPGSRGNREFSSLSLFKASLSLLRASRNLLEIRICSLPQTSVYIDNPVAALFFCCSNEEHEVLPHTQNTCTLERLALEILLQRIFSDGWSLFSGSFFIINVPSLLKYVYSLLVLNEKCCRFRVFGTRRLNCT